MDKKTNSNNKCYFVLENKDGLLTLKTNRKEGNVLFNNAFNIFYLQLYSVGHMVKDRSDSQRGNLLLPHGLLTLICSKGSFICIIPKTG